jgi:hypothetical protein
LIDEKNNFPVLGAYNFIPEPFELIGDAKVF